MGILCIRALGSFLKPQGSGASVGLPDTQVPGFSAAEGVLYVGFHIISRFGTVAGLQLGHRSGSGRNFSAHSAFDRTPLLWNREQLNITDGTERFLW